MAKLQSVVPARGDSTLFMRDVDDDVIVDVKALASARSWTHAQVLAQLVELRKGCLAIASSRGAGARPVLELLERLALESRSV